MGAATGLIPHVVCIATAARLAAKLNELADGCNTATVVVRKEDYKQLCDDMPHQTASAFVRQVRLRLEMLLQPAQIESIRASPQQKRDFTVVCELKG